MATNKDAAAAADVAQDDPKRHIFPLFDLPRELRDLIYDEMLVPEVLTTLECKLKLKAKNVVDAKLVTFCRQFASEYKERAQEKSSLAVIDTIDFEPGVVEALTDLPTAAQFITTVHAGIACRGNELSCHYGWLSSLPQSRHIGALSIKCFYDLGFEDYDTMSEDIMPACIGLAASLKNLTSFEVFVSTSNTCAAFDFDDRYKMILKWPGEKDSFDLCELDGLRPYVVKALEQ